MEKIDLKFLCDLNEKDSIIANVDNRFDFNERKYGMIRIRVITDEEESFVFLDKSTAIKFAKTLRTEINKIKEVSNV